MIKQAGIIIGVALLLDVALFIGIGVGLGALATVNSGNSNTNYAFTYAESGQNWGDGLSYHVDMPSVNQSGDPMVTGVTSGYKSTQLTFQTIFYSHGDCGNTGQPVLAPGVSGNYAYYIVSFGGGSFTGTLDGSSFAATTALAVSENSSGVVLACGLGISGNDYPNPQSLTSDYAPLSFQHTLVLIGAYPAATLSITLEAQGTNCGGTSPSSAGAVCAAAQALYSANGGGVNGPSGSGFFLASVASTTVQSGAGTVTVTNPGNLAYNGGTVTAVVAAGYAGSQGWTVSMICPVPRTVADGGCAGGLPDSRFTPQHVNSDCAACPVTWTVPAGTSQSSSTLGWNTWELNLSNGLINEGYTPVTINIQPPTSPTTPTSPAVTFSNNGKFYYPTPGSTLTVTIYANASSQSGPIVGVTVWAYYLAAGQNPVNEPSCGSSWITTGCPGGTSLGAAQVQSNGANGLVGTYSFAVSPPAGTTQIGLLVESFASGQQGSPIVPLLIQVAPANCVPGSPGCQSKTSVSTWTTIGPILLSLALVLAGILVAIAVTRIPVAVRVLAGAAPVALVALFYWFGVYSSWFAFGGPLGVQ